MKLTKISKDFTPLDVGIIFGIDTESDTPNNLQVEIVESLSGEVVATQQLRQVCQAELNIAPYIERFAERTPSQRPYTTFTDAPTATHHIRIGDATSHSTTTSVNRVQVATPALVSAMPHLRTIPQGGHDEVMILADEGALISANITTDKGEELSLDYTSPTGAVLLTLATADFALECRTIEVALSCDGSQIGQLRYNIAPNRKSAVRLAWISEQGTIERYTFPALTSATHKADEHTVTLQSHYEPRATIDALAQIVAAPKVWIERNSSYREVEVATSTIDYNLFGEPDSIAIALSVKRGEEVLW